MNTAPLTPSQRGKIHACLGALHVTERAEKLRVTSSNDLTRDEAHVCIDVLEAISRRDDAAEYLTLLVRDGERYLASVSA